MVPDRGCHEEFEVTGYVGRLQTQDDRTQRSSGLEGGGQLQLIDRLHPERYALWLDAVFGVFDAWPDFDPREVFALSPLAEPTHGFDAAEICNATIQTFERGDRDLSAYSDHAVGCGLRALVDTGFADLSLNMYGRADVLRAFGQLYANCLSVRSPHVLGSLSEQADPASAELATITYMLWDVAYINHWPDDRDHRVFAPVFLDMLEQVILTNTNPACIESALHGIGHASSYRHAAPAVEYIDRRRERMINSFLARRQSLRPELLAYARAARTGMII